MTGLRAAAARAETAAAVSGCLVDDDDPLGIAAECPDQGDDPADQRPSQEQVQQQHSAEVGLVIRKDRRQKIQRKRREK